MGCREPRTQRSKKHVLIETLQSVQSVELFEFNRAPTKTPPRAQDGPKTPPRCLAAAARRIKTPQGGSKTPPRRLAAAARRPNKARRRLQGVLRPPQEGPRRPKTAQHGPKSRFYLKPYSQLFNFNRRPGRGSAKERQRAPNPYFFYTLTEKRDLNWAASKD